MKKKFSKTAGGTAGGAKTRRGKNIIYVKVRKIDNVLPLPSYQTPGAAGLDLFSREDSNLKYRKPTLVRTGIEVAIPVGYEAQIRPRSGLALKKGITVLNSPGTIDSDYRGEIGVIMINLCSAKPVGIKRGERIAQMVFSRYETVKLVQSAKLSKTKRGAGGFGSTRGVNIKQAV